MTKRAPPLNMSSWDVYRYVYISICTVTDHSLSGNQVCSVWQCSCALVILVLIITIGNSYKAPFSNRAELTVLYKQLITTRTQRTRNIFICCYRINQIYQTLSLSLTHTTSTLYFKQFIHIFTSSTFKKTEILYHNLTELCNIALRLKLHQLMQRTLFSTTDPLFFTLPHTVILTSDLRSTASARFCTIYNSRNDTPTKKKKKKKKKILYTYNA